MRLGTHHHQQTYVSKDMKGSLPKLRLIAPLTWSICWIFAFINLFICYALIVIYNPTVPIAIVTNIFNLTFWGIVFGTIGVLGAVSLIMNRWEHTRTLLLVGLVVKFFWEVALIIRTLQEPTGTILLTVMWTFFALIQAATFIWFLPSVELGRTKDNAK